MAGLTTHVLDTTAGRPAAGVRIELYEIADDGARRPLREAVTNADGRTDAPLIPAGEARAGRFELVFHIGAYFAAKGATPEKPGVSNDWFAMLYQVLLGESRGPRFGSFVALYGVAETRALIARALSGALKAEHEAFLEKRAKGGVAS